MHIENSRLLKRYLLFTIVGEEGDPRHVTTLCENCPIFGNGCSPEADPINKIISARVNLDSFRVQLLEKNKEEVNCGHGVTIRYKAH